MARLLAEEKGRCLKEGEAQLRKALQGYPSLLSSPALASVLKRLDGRLEDALKLKQVIQCVVMNGY